MEIIILRLLHFHYILILTEITEHQYSENIFHIKFTINYDKVKKIIEYFKYVSQGDW